MNDIDISTSLGQPSAETDAQQPSSSRPLKRTAPTDQPKRSIKACFECRSKKQRCSGPSSIPCDRCVNAKRSCSFETEYIATDAGHAPRPVAFSIQSMIDMQAELDQHAARIENLEALLGASARPTAAYSPSPVSEHVSNGNSATVISPAMQSYHEQADSNLSLHGVDVGVPVAFLHSMDDRVRKKRKHTSVHPLSSGGYPFDASKTDPVKRGILDMDEAQLLFDIFWTHCAPICNVLCRETQRRAFQVSMASPLLFTMICSVGARFFNTSKPEESILHPAYWHIIDLVDKQLAEMLLRPKTSEIVVEAIQALLLYCQYSPLQPIDDSEDTARTRFSESRAWLVISLALRLAKVLRLGQQAADFPGNPSNVTQQHMKNMRVWINLLSVDHLLSLSANLVPSLDPSPAARGVRDFASNPLQQEADFRAAGMYEVILIVHRLASFGQDDVPLARIGSGTLKRANEELNEWERRWTFLSATNGIALTAPGSSAALLDPQFTFPITSLRWYRIALNSASTGPYISSSQDNGDYLRLQGTSLSIAVEAAAQMLWRFSLESLDDSSGLAWQAHHQRPLSVNTQRARALGYSVDSYWLTHSFAAALLAIAYDRGAIDASLQLQAPPRPRQAASTTSAIVRLLELAVALVNQVRSMALHHPAAAYLPYFQAALQTCYPTPPPTEFGNFAPANHGPSTSNNIPGTSNDDDSLESILQLLASKENLNMGLFQDTVLTGIWDGSWT